MQKKVIILLVLFVDILFANTKVTFINPGLPGNLFWDKVVLVMTYASKDLEIDLKILYPLTDRQSETERLAVQELNSSNKPNYIIFPYMDKYGEKILEVAENNKVYSFIINTDIPESEKKSVKTPGVKYKYWIGHIFPDDFQAGYILGKSLIKEAKTKLTLGSDKKIHISALSGSRITSVSEERNSGLKKAIEESDSTVLEQIFYTYWHYDNAVYTTTQIFSRYPITNVLWCASDTIGLGAINASTKAGKSLGKSILVGGIDWSDEGFELIKNKTLFGSVGGHFLEGASSLIYIKDHSKGLNINIEKFPIKTPMYLITYSNLNTYLKLFDEKNFKTFSYKKLSKYYTKNAPNYNSDFLYYFKKYFNIQ